MIEEILHSMLELHSLAEIAEELQTSPSNVEMILRRLEGGGYVRRFKLGGGQCGVNNRCAGCVLSEHCRLSYWELTEKGRERCLIQKRGI